MDRVALDRVALETVVLVAGTVRLARVWLSSVRGCMRIVVGADLIWSTSAWNLSIALSFFICLHQWLRSELARIVHRFDRACAAGPTQGMQRLVPKQLQQ